MQLLKDYAMHFIGQPYIWGGDDPTGFDCSGLIIEILQSCGQLPPNFDTTAQGLYKVFLDKGVISAKGFGSLAFYGQSRSRIIHVAFGLDNIRVLEAGGGGRHVKTLADAIKYNAFIRIRPIQWRSDLVAIIKPRYGLTW